MTFNEPGCANASIGNFREILEVSTETLFGEVTWKSLDAEPAGGSLNLSGSERKGG